MKYKSIVLQVMCLRGRPEQSILEGLHNGHASAQLSLQSTLILHANVRLVMLQMHITVNANSAL